GPRSSAMPGVAGWPARSGAPRASGWRRHRGRPGKWAQRSPRGCRVGTGESVVTIPGQLQRCVKVGGKLVTVPSDPVARSGGSRMHIGEFAERTGLSSRTLRHYEDIGLIPRTGRTEGGFRLYTEEDLRRMLTIRRMKALGYSTREMGELLELLDIFEGQVPEEERESARARLLATLEDAQLRREKLARQVGRADEFLAILRERRSCAGPPLARRPGAPPIDRVCRPSAGGAAHRPGTGPRTGWPRTRCSPGQGVVHGVGAQHVLIAEGQHRLVPHPRVRRCQHPVVLAGQL